MKDAQMVPLNMPDKLIEGISRAAQVSVQFAERFEAMGDFERALEHIEKAIVDARLQGLGAAPLSRLLSRLAGLCRRAGHLARAATAFHEAVALAPAERSIWMALAATYRDARSWPAAITIFQKILQDNPSSRAALYGLTEVLGLSGQPVACAQTFPQVTEPVDSESFLAARIWFQRSMLHLGRDKELLDFLNQRAKLNPRAFVHPSWQQDLEERPSTPSIFIISLKRSGTVYILRRLAEGCGMPMVRLACGDFFETILIEENLRLFSGQGMVSLEHLAPGPIIFDALARFGIRPIVHLRDPRQSMISWLHYVDREISAFGGDVFYLDVATNWADLTVGQKADWCIDYYFPRIIDWIKGWVAAANAKPSLDILFTHFEQMKSDEPSFFKTLLSHAGHEYGSFGDSKMNEDTMRSSANYHLGETDEWRRILNNAQIQKLNQLIPDELAERFKWIKV
jgi:tetratricopeptide (TPR) repeat protein